MTAVKVTLTAAGTTLDLSAGKAVKSEVATFSSSDLKETASDFSATVFWGDGDRSDGVVTSLGRGTGNFIVTASHNYSKNGLPTETATVVVHDTTIDATDGASVTTNVNIAGTAISNIVALPVTAMEGSPLTNVVVATFQANYKGAKVSDFGINPEWNDGTGEGTATILPVAGSPGKFEIEISHTFPQATNDGDPAGPSSITNFITDTALPSPKTHIFRFGITSPVNIADAPLQATGSPVTIQATAGQSTGYVNLGSFLDTNTFANPDDLNVSVNWGDQSAVTNFSGTGPLAGYVDGTPSSYDVISQHTYATAGDYPVTITVLNGTQSTVVLHATAVVSSPTY